MLAAGISGVIIYSQPSLTAGSEVYKGLYKGLSRINNEAKEKQLDTELSSYIKQLIAIQHDASTKHYLVYIAKAEEAFWNADLKNCKSNPLLITAVSERPAIYGLPDPDCQEDNTYGYRAYEKKLFNIASTPDIPHNLLTAEVRKLGFKGYISVTSKSWTKHSIDCY